MANWALAWGAVGVTTALILIIVEPDTGHISRTAAIAMIALPTALVGTAAGGLFGALRIGLGVSRFLVVAATLIGGLGAFMVGFVLNLDSALPMAVMIGCALGLGLSIFDRRQSRGN